jgi:hypothetical protein
MLTRDNSRKLLVAKLNYFYENLYKGQHPWNFGLSNRPNFKYLLKINYLHSLRRFQNFYSSSLLLACQIGIDELDLCNVNAILSWV